MLRRQPRVTSHLNSTVAANGYCARAPAQHHQTLYCVTPDASGAHRTRAQRAPQTRRVTEREPPDALLRHTGRVRCTPDPCAESSANSEGHRTQVTGRTLSVRCSLVRNTSHALADVTPHRTRKQSLPSVRCQRPVRTLHLCQQLTVHRTLTHSVRCLHGLRPVSVFPEKNTPATSPNFPPAQ